MAQRLLTALILGLVLSWPARAVETLRVLAWPGYVDADLVKAFEVKNQVRVELSLVSSDDALRERVKARLGGDFDVVAANTVEIKGLIDGQWVQPLTLANIPNTARQLPRFRNAQAIAGITRQDQVYAVPYTYAEMGLIYDRAQFKTPPTSWSVLWDPAYRGRVLAFQDSNHGFSVAALSLGKPPFQISPRDMGRTIQRLIALRRNVLAFYTLPEESVQLFQQHKSALLFANYGRQQLKLLRDAGADVGYVIPHEGALAWLDCWAVTRGAKNKALAERWIDFMLTPQVSSALTERHGLSNTLRQGDDLDAGARIVWLEAVEDSQVRQSLWTRIFSGDVPERF